MSTEENKEISLEEKKSRLEELDKLIKDGDASRETPPHDIDEVVTEYNALYKEIKASK